MMPESHSDPAPRIGAHSGARIVLTGLVKRYHNRPVLDRLSLTLEGGQFCILVGANGAGKTTLLRILATLTRPDEGEIQFFGEAWESSSALRTRIGYIGHQPMFYLDLTAAENLRHYARLYHCDDSEEHIQTALHAAGLENDQHKPVRTFSRGMQQRLSIARALLHDPEILLLDEPYTGLDQPAAQSLDRRLRGLHSPERIILMAAHRPQRLLTIATHIAWLQNGVISHHLPVGEQHTVPTLQAYLQESA